MGPASSSMSGRRGLTGAAAVLCSIALGGCGVGAGSTPNAPVALNVTRDFGASSLVELPAAKFTGSDTVLSLLQRNAPGVKTDPGGKVVQAIDGVSAGTSGGRPLGWFAYVNGILVDKDAVDVHGGDRVWWDQHDRGVTADSRAVVGSFPEPFVHGTGGKRLPVRVECVDPNAAACKAVSDKLLALKVPIGLSNISRSAADESLRVLVGPWNQIRGRDAESDAIDSGPKASGVYARFAASGSQLVVLDARGAVARTLGPGTGFIAATRSEQRQPVWFVTGTDDAGVASAARALDEGVLSDRFALAISNDLPVAVPAG